jgi:hypothetical protein
MVNRANRAATYLTILGVILLGAVASVNADEPAYDETTFRTCIIQEEAMRKGSIVPPKPVDREGCLLRAVMALPAWQGKSLGCVATGMEIRRRHECLKAMTQEARDHIAATGLVPPAA